MAKKTKQVLQDLVLRKAPGSGNSPNSQPQKKSEKSTAISSRINLIPLVQVIPDPLNARALLPLDLADDLRLGKKNLEFVLKEWWARAKKSDVLKTQINSLLTLADSMDEFGQIKALTAVWENTNNGQVARIETGHRRFFAVGLLAIKENRFSTSKIEVRFVEQASWERQRDENETAQQLSGIGRAFNVAKELLQYFDIHYDHVERPYAFARRALDLPRVKAGQWPKLEKQMGMSRTHVRRLLNLLNFPDELLDLADRANLTERTLRDIHKLPPKRWAVAIQNAVDQTLQFPAEEDSSKKSTNKKVSLAFQATRRGKSFLKTLIDEKAEIKYSELAKDISVQLGQPEKVNRAISQLEKLILELKKFSKNTES